MNQTIATNLTSFFTNLAETPLDADVQKPVDVSNSVALQITIGQFNTLHKAVDPVTGERFLMPHPRQRDIEARLGKALRKGGHLSTFSLSHTDLVLAVFRGKLYLVDGNHRVRAWMDYPDACRPSHVTLNIKYFDDADEEGFIKLYYAYDSKASVETRRQKLYGYMADAGYVSVLKTDYVRKGQFASALAHLPGYLNDEHTMFTWQAQFLALDEDLARASTKFDIGVVAALLIKYRTEPRAEVSDFLEQLQRLKEIRIYAKNFKQPLTDSQQVIDDYVMSCERVLAKGSENVITQKKNLTLAAYELYRASLRREAMVIPELKAIAM